MNARAAQIVWCKANPTYQAKYRKLNAEKIRAYKHAYHKANAEKLCAYQRARRTANPETVRAEQRKKNGLPSPLRPCPSLCECCGGPTNGQGTLHLDHNHQTGQFRGWLCSNCNTGIGKLGDSIEGLEKAIRYLSNEKTAN